jgi:hypothetical protein
VVDVSGYLASKGLPLKRADAKNVHTACMFCSEDPAARGRLYINVDPDAEIAGLFFCHRCQEKGSLASLKRHYGDQVADDDLDHQTRLEIFGEAAAYYQSVLRAFGEVTEYLTGPQRGLTPETIEARRLGYAPMAFSLDVATDITTVTRPNLLYRHLIDSGFATKDILVTGLCHESQSRKIVDALGGMVTIPYEVAGNCVAIRGRTWPMNAQDFALWAGAEYTPPANKYKTCGGSSSRLFNTDACWDSDEIVITEGELDAIVLEQHGFRAVAAPGATAWQESWDDYLTNIKRVWLLYDRDAAGEKAALRLSERLGSKIRRVFLSEVGVKCDPTEWFARDGHSAAEFEELLAVGRKGALLVSVHEARAEYQAVQSQPGLKFGWELFDIMLDPGLQPGQLMVVLAKTGSGKTIFVLNMMHRARLVPEQADLKILFVSLEQTRGEWWDRARRLHRFFDLDADEEDAARFWERNIMLVDRNRVTATELRQVLDDFAYQMGRLPDLMCLDYLGYWARSFKGEAYQRTSDAVMAIKGIAKEFLIPTIVPHQVSRIGIDGQEFGPEAARDSGVVEETADHLLTMWTPDNTLGRDEEEKTGQIHLRIGKSRHGGRGVLLDMQFAPVSLVMVPEGHPECAMARREIAWKREYRDNWDKVVYRHRTGFEGHLTDSPLTEQSQVQTWR